LTGQKTGVGHSCFTGTIARLLLLLPALLLPLWLLLGTMPQLTMPLLYKSMLSRQSALLARRAGLTRSSDVTLG
tara:strand:- start:375 stop:596 length:222 start_codon:yes stop_codon:yes gene_type:complete